MPPVSPHASIAHRINAERLMLLGWGRAILLQLAHPLVAAGVYDHSSFRAHPWSAAVRLRHTVRAMLALTFGTDRQRQAALDGIRQIHRRIHGTLPVAAGPFAAGTPYSAEDPDLVTWVHVTLLDSVPRVYELVVAPLSDAERDAYCADAAGVAIELGAHSGTVPRTWAAAQQYCHQVYAAHTLAVSPQARELAHAVMHPPFATLAGPLASINRTVTFGLLPSEVRRQYGVEWTTDHQRRFERLLPRLRAARRAMPRVVALWPEARTKGG